MRLRSRVRTSAAPEHVWAVLGDPRRWPEFDLTLTRVHGSPGHVATGQRLLGVGRAWGVRVPLDVVEAVPERRLVLRVSPAPGVAQEVTTEIVPRGQGCEVIASAVVEGLFARMAVVPFWVTIGITTRLLVVRAERLAAAAQKASGAA
ncbi:MAG: SRPBCC family protein [Actinomycetota bacterium]|nr:SRPBCC family protein [Actinomycetota bacterium]